MSKSTLLPVLWEERTIDIDDELKNETDTDYQTKETNNFQYSKTNIRLFILSFFLSLLTILSFFLYAFSADSKLISAERFFSYLSNDFLGIDLSNTDKNIFEILMSEGFGNTSIDNEENNKTPNKNDNTPETNDDQSSSDTSTNENINQTPPPTSLPDGEFAIISTDLSSKEISISNKTDYTIEIDEYLSKENNENGYTLSINEDMTVDPIVLIIHTHGTEGFSIEGRNSYSDTVNIPRSENTEENIVAVGAEMSKILNESGIPTVHCQTMHDKESYKNSYERAEQTIKSYLHRYPSIKYVLDIHRDSIIDSGKIKYKPVTSINGEQTAQIMLVMGSDKSSPEHANWKDNLTLALKLTKEINNNYIGMTRTISLRESSYNQQYTKGSLLIEIGSCANTLQEAKRAGIIVAKSLSSLIKEGW